jgi:hypothetical protein
MAEVKITADSGGGSVALKGPASTTGNAAVSLKLPVADGSANQLLKTDGSGNLGWATDQGGKIIQVVHVNSTDHLNSTATSYTDLPGVTASITPTSSSNKVLIQCNISISKYDNHSFIGRIVRDGSAITGAGGLKESGHNNQADGVWWNIRTGNYHSLPGSAAFLDSPATTSSVTYKAQGYTTASANGFSLNMTNASEDVVWCSPTYSSITLWEVSV